MRPPDVTDPHVPGEPEPAARGFHEGELSVQRQAGLSDQASRLAGMLDAPDISGGMGRFAADQSLAMITSLDDQRRLWTSPLYGRPGFCDAHGATLAVTSLPIESDPLHKLRPGECAGTLLVDFEKRRRLRINGTIVDVGPSGFEIAADQAFGNCPQFIQQRRIQTLSDTGSGEVEMRQSQVLHADDVRLIEQADTLILGTAHPTRGADTSHRGGARGFVRVDGDGLWWPDYPGNNLFNSMGNILESPATALLFFDFAEATTLQLSGQAVVEWITPGSRGDDGQTGRRIRFTPEEVVRTLDLPFQMLGYAPYAKNLPLT
ncbi:MAG: hypothetical protein ABS81_21050 [Pseudonocardia sp. SCN 72-86]|nr:MAG: hypothetical protein ABS81_21050 [Pseudonocardia sp. SCN 72-86]